MKSTFRAISIFITVVLSIPVVYAQESGELFNKARQGKLAAMDELGTVREEIYKEENALETDLFSKENGIKTLNLEISELESEFKKIIAEEEAVTVGNTGSKALYDELQSAMKVSVRDVKGLILQSPFTAIDAARMDKVEGLERIDRTLDAVEINALAELIMEEARLSGSIGIHSGQYTDRSGAVQKGDILIIGRFMAAYKKDGEVGLLRYSPENRRLMALSVSPPWSVSRSLKNYADGNSDTVKVDISGGAALSQITGKSTFSYQIKSGGPLVWPILGIGLAALVIIIERLVFLKKVHVKSDDLMDKIKVLAGEGRWDDCEGLLGDRSKPINNVLKAAIANRRLDRESIESALQEAMLKEFSPLERRLPTLNVLGAIAPLLGLLGTVTGMISTFNTITVYGTGNPRMMAGGISEALVTTMLGLYVAIPIMFFHTFIGRRADGIIADIEEKAIALINIIDHGRKKPSG